MRYGRKGCRLLMGLGFRVQGLEKLGRLRRAFYKSLAMQACKVALN